MKARFIAAVLLAGCVAACNPDQIKVKDPIKVSSPQPKEQITKVSLTTHEAAMVGYGNELTFKMLPLLREGNKSFIFSPLSIQYALGMTANGASGETLSQMLGALGFWGKNQELISSDIQAMNSLCNKLLNELPAVDLDVKLQLADAILVNDLYPLHPDFKQLVESTYYAAVENMSFDDPTYVAARINEWASRNTNGLIKKMLEPSDIDPAALAFLMNALYFKAPWVPRNSDPLFMKESTRDQEFYLEDSSVKAVPTMHTYRNFRYADFDSFRVLEIPYASGKFAMYILLPDNNTFDSLLKDSPTLDWKAILSKLDYRTVNLSLPRFETSSSYHLNDALQKLGMTQAFTGAAQFDRMFADPAVQACIDMVIQKARISVTEWGTEAAAVTVVGMKESSAYNPEPPVDFICDHPFAYLIAEKTSGTILFAGAYCGN